MKKHFREEMFETVKTKNSAGGVKMRATTAKRVLIFVIAVFSMSLMIGCAHMDMEKAPEDRQGGFNKPGYVYYHKPLPEAARALNEARAAGKDRKCPVEFNAAKDMVDKAYELYRACHTEEAIAMAQEAIVKIKALCPARPVTEAGLQPKAEGKVIVVAFEDIHFDFNQSTLKPEAQAILKRDVQKLNENPKTRIRIAGYTSASGTEAYNQKLSERRANAVREYLINEGIITPDRLTIIGYGETRPAEYEAAPKELYSKAAKANMRVLFEIIVQ